MTTWDCWAIDEIERPRGEAHRRGLFTIFGMLGRLCGVAWSVLVVLSLISGAGCRSMLELPDRAKQSGYDPQTPAQEGWLFRHLTGHTEDTPQASRENTHRESDPAVDAARSSAASQSTGSASARQANLAGQADSLARRDQLPGQVIPASGEEPNYDKAAQDNAVSRFPAADEDTVIVPPTFDSEEDEETEDFILFEIPKRIAKLFQPKRDERLARSYFQEGLELYQAKEYQAAAKKFKRAAKHWPKSPLEEDALFLTGESYFFADRYPQAEEAYQELVKKYEFTRYLDTVSKREFAIGRYWEQLELSRPSFLGLVQVGDTTRPTFDTWGRAVKAYQNVRLHDPTGPLADDSLMATGNAYFLKHRYEDAAFHYDLLRKDYSQSEHAVNAALLAVRSHEASYQGPLYDSAPLEKAEKAADELLSVYTNRLGKEKEDVIRAKNRITEEKAMRYFVIGQYYDDRKYYGAARYYYRIVLREFPHSKAAVQAAERIQQIDGLPDKPPNHFQWLTDLFERRDE